MNLNEAYDLYKSNPAVYADPFGVELLKFCKAGQKTFYRNPDNQSSVSSWYSTDDVVSSALSSVWEHLPEYNPERGQFDTWVWTILKYSFVDYFRKNKTRNEVALTEDVASYEPHRDIEDKLLIKQLLAELKVEDKSFIKMKLAGLTEAELGQAFGKDARWANDKYRNLVKKLRYLAS